MPISGFTPDPTATAAHSDEGDSYPTADLTIVDASGASTLTSAGKLVATIPGLADYLINGFWQDNSTIAHHWGITTISYNINGLNTAEKFLAQSALNAWHEVANLSFVLTTGSANITFNHNGNMTAFETDSYNGSGIMSSSTIDISANWITTDGGANDGKTGIDSYGYQTYLHEVGHALGLGHQGPYNGTASYSSNALFANDTWQYSIMSYFSEQNYDGGSYRYVITPQMADIYAVAAIYGAATTRTGSTTYGFNSTAGSIYDFSSYTQAPALTIYDSGGSDTIDASGYSSAQTIDLHAGSFSSIGGLVHNIGIAVGVTLELAIGGGGNDTLIANDFGNTLRGGAGGDSLTGGTGDDTFVGGSGNDTIIGGAGTDSAIFSGLRSSYALTDLGSGSVRVSGIDNVDTLSSVERLVFDDQTITWPLPTDLTASNLTLSGLSVTYRINNVGPNSVIGSATGIYLSTDTTITTADTLIASTSAALLASGAFDIKTLGLTFPTNLNPGTYYLGAMADYDGRVIETNEANNASNVVAVILGNDSSNTLSGAASNDTLIGNDGNDVLNGGTGADLMVGGRGDDTYVVDDAGDVVTEASGTPFVVPSGWTVNGTADFNGDGEMDVTVGSGSNYQMWLLRDGAVLSTVTLPTWTNWVMLGVLDEDNDGDKDLLYSYVADGHQFVVHLNGPQIAGVYSYPQVNETPDAVQPLTANQGTDTVQSSLSYTLGSGVENLTLTGSGNINGTGNGSANVIIGNTGDNTLSGKGGVDTLTGNGGIDTFSFAMGDTGATTGLRDLVTDFTVGTDLIDLAGIDANTGASGINAFRFLGSSAFDGQAAALRYGYDTSRGVTVVEGDINGDRIADFGIELTGNKVLAASDFTANSTLHAADLTEAAAAGILTVLSSNDPNPLHPLDWQFFV